VAGLLVKLDILLAENGSNANVILPVLVPFDRAEILVFSL
jgi:hypothetical protein